MKLLVCFDIERDGGCILDDVVRGKPDNVDVHSLQGKQLACELNKLFRHVEDVLKGANQPLISTLFNRNYDIALIDNNLASLELGGIRFTAEAIASYIRAFTEIPYVISINKNIGIDFDLRYLVGDAATKADFSLNQYHLQNPALWTGNREDAADDFIPWYWPRLLAVANRRRKQIDFVRANLNNPVLERLGFAEDRLVQFLSRRALELLTLAEDLKGAKPTTFGSRTNFADIFLASDRSLASKTERHKLIQRLDSDCSNKRFLARIISRAVASDIDLWLRRDVLPAQDVLIDVPHLLAAMPFLISDEIADDFSAMNRDPVDVEGKPPYGIRTELFENHLNSARFKHEFWLKSPCFWWPQLSSNHELGAYYRQLPTLRRSFAFCEDISGFLPADENGDIEAPFDFTVDVEEAWSMRSVAKIEGMHYAPRSRFASF